MCLPEGEKDRERAMALEAMLYAQQPQDHPFATNNNKDLLLLFDNNNTNSNNYDLLLQGCCGGGSNNNNNNNNLLWGYGGSDEDFNSLMSIQKQEEGDDQQQGGSMTTFLDNQTTDDPMFPNYEDWSNSNNCSTLPNNRLSNVSNEEATALMEGSTSLAAARPKKRRTKSRKNKEEIENQRMTHIAVERNRRKQMNEYLSVLRSLMPESYVQRGDQASIIGGAINYVKELEQRLQFFGVKKEADGDGGSDQGANMPFSEFFAFPQYSSTSGGGGGGESSTAAATTGERASEVKAAGIADIEVTMVESHANLKIRAKKRPKQLLKMVSSLHGMRLTILHLNVTTTGDVVLYSLSVKVEDDCKLGSVDEIAAAVYQMLDRIQQESMNVLN